MRMVQGHLSSATLEMAWRCLDDIGRRCLEHLGAKCCSGLQLADGMLEYFGICRNMLEYVGICCRQATASEYVGIFVESVGTCIYIYFGGSIWVTVDPHAKHTPENVSKTFQSTEETLIRDLPFDRPICVYYGGRGEVPKRPPGPR